MRASNGAQCGKAAGRLLSIAVPFLGSVAQSGRIWSLNFFCWPMPGNGVLICLTLHPAIVIAASTSSRMPSINDTMASGLCSAMRSARCSRAATQASRRALPRRLLIGVIERSSGSSVQGCVHKRGLSFWLVRDPSLARPEPSSVAWFRWQRKTEERFAPKRIASLSVALPSFALMSFATLRSAPPSFAPRRFASRRSAPLRFAPLRFAPLRSGRTEGSFCPPSVPAIDALPEECEMLWVGH